MWTTPVTNFTHVCQEIWKLWLQIHWHREISMTVTKAIFTKPKPAWQNFSKKKANCYTECNENSTKFSRRYEAAKIEEKTDGRCCHIGCPFFTSWKISATYYSRASSQKIPHILWVMKVNSHLRNLPQLKHGLHHLNPFTTLHPVTTDSL